MLKSLEKLKQLEIDLEAVFAEYEEKLDRIKGFSFNSIATVISILLSAAPIMVPLWLEASPTERKTAVVNIVNRHVDLPVVNEQVEAVILGFIYDVLTKSVL